MSDNDIAIVCFDLGGVIVRIWRTWPDVCRAAGLPVRGNWEDAAVRTAHRELIERYSVGAIDHATWASHLSEALGGVYSPNELDRLHHAVTRTEYDGVSAIVDDLHARGVRTACLSNTSHAHWVRLIHRDGDRDLPGPPEYPTVRKLQGHYASHIIGALKPDDAIYRAFEGVTGYSAQQILFFDDLAPNVAAAKARGWRAECVDHTAETAPQLRRALASYGLL